MAEPDQAAILTEIAETERRIGELQRSMQDITIASNETVIRSRELIGRIERQLLRR